MKMNKIMMLAMAGMAFAACSNENEVGNPAPEGVGAVSIRIKNPEISRAIADAGTAAKVTPQSGTTVNIKLNASVGGGTISLTPEQYAAGQEVTFWNVQSPTSVEISMNGGLDMTGDDGKALNIATNLQQAPAAIPVYGKADVELTTQTQTPGESSLDNNHQSGLTGGAGEDDMQYPIYEAEVTLEIPVARLEVSGIKLADAAKSDFTTITIDGVYMDNIKPTVEGSLTDYQFVANGGGTGEEAILKDAEGVSFLNGTFPDDTPAKVYAYNFFGSDNTANNPKFKIAFSNVEGAAGKVLPAKGWAIIENYYSDDTKATPIALKNGKIYQITGAELTTDNIVPDENGNTTYSVNVTVVEANWSVQTTYASWAD